MGPIILIFPFAAVVFGALFMLLHGLSPLGTKLAIDSKRRYAILYAIIILPLLTIPLCFTNILNNASGPALAAFITVSILLTILSAECSYFLSKTKKWHKLLTGASVLTGTIYMEISILMLLLSR